MRETAEFSQPDKSVEIAEDGDDGLGPVYKILNELGQEIGYFKIEIDERRSLAFIRFVQIDEDKRDEDYGIMAYRKLAGYLEGRGLKLASRGNFAHDAAEKIWVRLQKEGRAKKSLFGKAKYKVK